MFFPIYDDTKPSKPDPLRPIKSLKREEIVKLFYKINPCKTGNQLLWVLHRLDVVDKHRRILTCTLVHHSVFIRDAMVQLFTEAGYADMIPALDLRSSFFTSNRTGKRAQVGDILYVGQPGEEEVNKKLKFTFDISFAEPGIVEGQSIVKTIDEMIVLVEGIVSSFEPFLI
jgi:hypothetical protein